MVKRQRVATHRPAHTQLSPGNCPTSHACSYNITLAAGDHALAVILANGMYNVRGDGRYTKFSNSGVFGPRTLWLSIDLTHPDGRYIPSAVVSDSQWLCDASGGPLTFTHACAAPILHRIYVTIEQLRRRGLGRSARRNGMGSAAVQRDVCVAASAVVAGARVQSRGV